MKNLVILCLLQFYKSIRKQLFIFNNNFFFLQKNQVMEKVKIMVNEKKTTTLTQVKISLKQFLNFNGKNYITELLSLTTNNRN